MCDPVQSQEVAASKTVAFGRQLDNCASSAAGVCKLPACSRSTCWFSSQAAKQNAVVSSPHTDAGWLYAAVQCSPPQISMQAARAESEMVMFESIKAALAKANLKPSQVRAPASRLCRSQASAQSNTIVITQLVVAARSDATVTKS